jgi:hypothetical protein
MLLVIFLGIISVNRNKIGRTKFALEPVSGSSLRWQSGVSNIFSQQGHNSFGSESYDPLFEAHDRTSLPPNRKPSSNALAFATVTSRT